MNDKVAALLNDQINKEFYSAYLYLAMSNYYDELDLDGYANYYMVQAQEERDHALLFLKYMQSVGLKVTLEAIEKPDHPFCIGLQWHPEHMSKRIKRQRKIFTAFVNACKK